MALAEHGGLAVPMADGRIAITGLDAPTVGHIAFVNGVELHELTTERPDLEGVFLELTRSEAAIR